MKSHPAGITVQSIKLGLVVQITGCAIFLALEELWQMLRYGASSFNSSVDIEIAILIFIVGNVLAFIPTVFCSCILLWALKYEASKGKLSSGRSKVLGFLIGLMAGIGVSALGIVLTNGRVGMLENLFRIVEVVAITSTAGVWLGKRMMQFIVSIDGVTA